jgi:hypothetical protein
LLTSEFDNFNFSLPHYYESGPNIFVYFGFTSPIFVPSGNFYVGTLQQSDVSLNFGLDKNTNANSTQLLYQLQGSSDWLPSNIVGSVMIRPVFRSTLPDWVGTEELNNDESVIFPNPVQGMLNLRLSPEFESCSYRIMDLTGKIVLEGLSANQSTLEINTENLSQGCYVIHYMNGDNEGHTARFVKE